MKKGLTAIFVLMDGSGSMNSLRQAVVDGINEFMVSQKNMEGEVVFSMAQFDSKYLPYVNNHGLLDSLQESLDYKLIYDFRNLKEVKPLTLTDYVPNGGTPLRDAMNKSIDEFGAKLSAIPEEYRPEKVVFLTFTDDAENASTHITQEDLVKKIKCQQDVFNWQFVYLGANQDSWAVSANYGMNAFSTMQYDGTYKGLTNSISCASASVGSYRSGITKDVILTDETEPKKSSTRKIIS